MKTLRQTISDTSRNFIINQNGLIGGQNLSAVGWCGGTVPSDIPNNMGILELPTSDVSNGGVMTGIALSGKRCQYIVRYQGFITYNGSTIFNYAAKSKEMWQTPCPIFVRAIAMEGGMGPVASNYHHSTAIRFPGIRVHVPITPLEWLECWNDFMTHDDPMYCSEHRKTYDFVSGGRDTLDYLDNASDYTVVGIGYARIAALEAAKELGFNFVKVSQLKPLKFTNNTFEILLNSDRIFVVDGDYEYCGASEYVSCEIMKQFMRPKAFPIGLKDKTAGFSPSMDNLTPSKEEIIRMVNMYT